MAKDCYGNDYVTIGNEAPTAGCNILIPDGYGNLTPGTWVGHVAKN